MEWIWKSPVWQGSKKRNVDHSTNHFVVILNSKLFSCTYFLILEHFFTLHNQAKETRKKNRTKQYKIAQEMTWIFFMYFKFQQLTVWINFFDHSVKQKEIWFKLTCQQHLLLLTLIRYRPPRFWVWYCWVKGISERQLKIV